MGSDPAPQGRRMDAGVRGIWLRASAQRPDASLDVDWPFIVQRLTVFGLVLGAPIAVTLAWYRGHRARHRVSGQELSILIALLVFRPTGLLGIQSPQKA